MVVPHVVVVGGGVGGLTVAHELIERGFSVDLYEARPDFGGKARSQPVRGTGTQGRKDLPGEHGFRFYPRFYRHVIDQMAKIPTGNGQTVADRLRPTSEAAAAMIDRTTWYRFSRRQLDTPYSLLEALQLFFQEFDHDGQDAAVFAAKMLQFATACDRRRLDQYERLSWWEFLAADRCSENYQRQLRSIPRMLVAMDSVRGSARTIGTTSIQLLRDFGTTGLSNDRTMAGPTTQMWIEPWIEHLAARGVGLHPGERATSIRVEGGEVAGIELASGAAVTADYYVLAVPLEGAIRLISPALGALDPTLDALRTQDPDAMVKWMVGIQFYLYEDVELVRGHLFFPDSPWALTAISQPQFWRDLGLFRRTFGNGDVGGLLSVDISEWETPGTFIPKPARDCTPEEVAHEVWQQLKAALNGEGDGQQILRDELLHSWHLDDDLDYSAGVPPRNHSPLLVHPPGSWALRPEAGTRVRNLMLAADYVRTHTDIASMEGACEAGRRAANAILERSGAQAARSQIWPLEESGFELLKKLDAWLLERGRPHVFEILGIDNGVAAAAWLRKVQRAVGLDKLDDWLDQLKPTAFLDWIAARVGVVR